MDLRHFFIDSPIAAHWSSFKCLIVNEIAKGFWLRFRRTPACAFAQINAASGQHSCYVCGEFNEKPFSVFADVSVPVSVSAIAVWSLQFLRIFVHTWHCRFLKIYPFLGVSCGILLRFGLATPRWLRASNIFPRPNLPSVCPCCDVPVVPIRLFGLSLQSSRRAFQTRGASYVISKHFLPRVACFSFS